ncbi:MAG: FeoB-associated Cys-rich membrane protein [Schwartzia sp.]|nr:FeoB-associated Cys-rich membrane protein [Schwartzia sp. (in: firmicutes)]
MATYILGAVIGASLIFAARHIYRNFADDKHDCCGTEMNCTKCPHCGK